jgi:signal peptidase I
MLVSMQKFTKALVWTVIVLVAIGGLLRALVLKTWTLPDDLQLAASIEPTLHNKDTVILLTRGTRGFGELVRCKDPDDPAKSAIGRIVGVEGDVIEIKGRHLYVNSKAYDPGQACPQGKYSFIHPNTEAEIELQCGIVDMGGGWHYRGNEKKNIPPGVFKAEVGVGKVFILSDNIDFHDDSRDYGTLDATSCTEKIIFRLWGEGGFKDEATRLSYIH